MTTKSRRSSTVALKIAMAVTGLIFIGFVTAHAVGNLKMLSGAESYNGYAHWLRVIGYPTVGHGTILWMLRIVLLVAVVIHVYCAVTLWRRASRARGKSYKVRSGQKTAAGYTTTLMRWGGVTLAVFIVFHILQFTTLTFEVGGDYNTVTPYDRMILAFQPHNWWLYAIYVLAIFALMFHVAHGFAAAIASLGWSNRRREKALKALSGIIALALALAFLTPPTAILFGWI